MRKESQAHWPNTNFYYENHAGNYSIDHYPHKNLINLHTAEEEADEGEKDEDKESEESF